MARALTTERSKPYPLHLYVGLGLALFFWGASWLRLGVLGEYAFFPQWLGYILAVDALVEIRRANAAGAAPAGSLLSRHPAEFVALFVLSAPIWWVFEGLNNFILNWHYLTAYPYSPAKIIAMSTLDFSTVIPAIFETTELVGTLPFLPRLTSRQTWTIGPRLPWVLMYLGAFAFAGVVLLPRFAFPLVWIWLLLIADPLNHLRGRPSLLAHAARGDWRLPIALALAGVTCGFFWEMWNSLAMPKWYYTVPFVGFGKVFEMPILGYLGYVPFAWELYALYHLIWGVLHRPAAAPHLGALAHRTN